MFTGSWAVLTPAEAGWHIELRSLSPVLRLGLKYAARVAGSGERQSKELSAENRSQGSSRLVTGPGFSHAER
jgi:hypothetical protein